MKNIINKLAGITLSLLVMAGMSSCYDTVLEFDDTTVINSEDGSVSSDSLSTIEEATGMIRNVQTQVISGPVHAYQNQETEYLIDFAGYMSNPHNFDGRLKSSFCFYDDFANGQMAQLQNLAPNCVPIMNSGKKLGIEPISALASILFSYSIYQCAVTYGPVPYDDFRALKSQRPLTYNEQSYVFEQLFIELIRADSILAAYKPGNQTLDNAIVQSNALTEGVEVSAQEAVNHWRKFANSMILRLAMTCVKVDGFTVNGKTVQTLAEEAVARGVLEAGDRQVALMSGTSGLFGALHPLYIVANQWVDARLHGTFHNILLRTNHPALETWFAKNSGQLTSKFNVVYDKSLVRGMGYYTGMVFEISSNKFSSSIGGGGRYDKMIGKFLGESVPAVGFSIGFERVCEILKDEDLQLASEQKVILIYSDNDDFAKVLEKFGEMQKQYTAVRLLKRSKKLGKQIDGLIDNGFNYSFSFGESSELKPLSK